MAHRLDVELTSSRDDGTWTWRAAGAKQPKGELNASLLYEGAAVSDICRIEAEQHVDGFEVLQVFAPKKKKERTDLLEIKRREFRDDELVTETKAKGGRGGDRKRGADRKGRGDRKGGNDRKGRGDRGPRTPRAEQEMRPKPKRLRAGNQHRQAVMAEVPEEFKPIAEQVSRGGMPAVRTAIDKQNADAKEAGTPAINPDPIIAIAEDLVPKLRTAEWHDRADAALKDLDQLDLRDLRSVASAADSAGRDEASQATVEQLKAGLNARIETDHQLWLSDLTEAMKQGRTVRALRLSSRPVKPGAPLPTELATEIAEASSQALAADVAQDRWATVVDAVAFSPIRSAVTPAGHPAEPTKDLLEAVRRVADRVPAIAALFGIDPSEATKRRRPRRTGANKPKAGGKPKAKGGAKPTDDGAEKKPQAGASDKGSDPAPQTPVTQAPETEAPAAETPVTEAPAAETPVTEAPAAETPVTEAPAAETPVTEAPAAETPVTEAPAAETPVTEAPAAETPAAGDAEPTA